MAGLGISGRLLGTDITNASPALQEVDEMFLVSPAQSLSYISEIKKIVVDHNVGLLVPLTDLDLRSLSRRREEFAQLGCTVMVGEEFIVKLCRDKRRFAKHLGKAGLPTIRTFSLEAFRKEPFYPCFAKPLHGSAGHGTAMIRTGRELRAHVHVFGRRLMVQDYIPGQEYTIDVYRTRAGEIKSIVPRQRLQVRGGEVDQAVTVRDEELVAATHQLVDSLDGLWGVFCCQCRRPEGKPPVFFELNPRFGGGVPLSIAAGADLPRYLLEDVLGLESTAQLGAFQENLLMLRYRDAFFQTIDDPTQLPGYETPTFQ